MDMKAWCLRTFVPLVAGALIAYGAHAGLSLDSATSAIVATALVTGAYALVARLVERHRPALGRWLMSAGLTRAQPAYGPPPGPPGPALHDTPANGQTQ